MEAAELAGTIVFAVSGVLAVAGRNLDWFGAIVVGVVTALGGGTIRGLILGVTPVFWIEDELFLFTAIAGAALAIPLARALEGGPRLRFERVLELADAAGLALFAVVGAEIALGLGFSAPVAVVAGLISGVGGGVIRDILAGRTPLIMSGELYATAALVGTGLYVATVELTAVPEAAAAVAGGALAFAIRAAAIRWSLALPKLDA